MSTTTRTPLPHPQRKASLPDNYQYTKQQPDEGFQSFVEYMTGELYRAYEYQQELAGGDISDPRTTQTFEQYIDSLDDRLNEGRNCYPLVSAENGDWLIGADAQDEVVDLPEWDPSKEPEGGFDVMFEAFRESLARNEQREREEQEDQDSQSTVSTTS